jgi:L-alanine-DL-glutamate epimerase-like enolase superfamily enzyme
MRIDVHAEVFPLAQAFTISRGSRSEARVVSVVVTDGPFAGRGECVPYARYGETIDSVTAQISALDPAIDRAQLQYALPAGAARNAVDCALWDLEAKRSGQPVWRLAGLSEPVPLVTAYTLSLDAPATMRTQAALHRERPLLKIKLGTPQDLSRLEAVRAGAPDPDIIVDANEGWSVESYSALVPHLLRLGVILVEQPLPAGHDQALTGLNRPVPVCADESCHDRSSLPELAGKYDAVNIKLDKTGGLTEALLLKKAAEQAGFGIMVGCMVGSSLGIAPAVLVGQGAQVVDLDGPLLLAKDRSPALRFDAQRVFPPQPRLWGHTT